MFLDLSTLSSFKFCQVLPCLQDICWDIWAGVILLLWSVKQVVSSSTIKYMQGIRPITTGEGNLNNDWVMQLLVQPQEVATRVQSQKLDIFDGRQRMRLCCAKVSLTETLNLCLLTQCKLVWIKVSAACLKCKCPWLKVKAHSALAIHHLFIPLTFWSI